MCSRAVGDVAARRLRGNQAHGGRVALTHGGGKIWRLNYPTEVRRYFFDVFFSFQ